MLLTALAVLVFSIPLALLYVAWRNAHDGRLSLCVLTLTAILLVLSVPPPLRTFLLGPDYSERLYFTFKLNLLLTFAAGLESAVRRRWTALAAAALLLLFWAYLALVNSAFQ